MVSNIELFYFFVDAIFNKLWHILLPFWLLNTTYSSSMYRWVTGVCLKFIVGNKQMNKIFLNTAKKFQSGDDDELQQA